MRVSAVMVQVHDDAARLARVYKRHGEAGVKRMLKVMQRLRKFKMFEQVVLRDEFRRLTGV